MRRFIRWRPEFWSGLVAVLFLLGCDSPSPAMMGSRNATIDVGGMTFGVHWTETAAEAYRTGWARRETWALIPANAKVAIESVTGCKVREGSLDGDPALMKARLNCSGAPPEPVVHVAIQDCQGETWISSGRDTETADIQCSVDVTSQ